MRKILAAVLCIVLIAGAPGCVTTQSIKPDAFDVAGNDDIHVYMRGRRMIEFEGGKYGSVDSSGTRYLVGNGIDHRPDSIDVRITFSGYLAFPAIERIETRKVDVYSLIYVTAFIGIFAFLGFSSDLNP